MTKLARALASAAGTAQPAPPFIDDVFSTYLYTGNGSTQIINNGIALADGLGGGTSGEFNNNGSTYLTRTSELIGNTDGNSATVSFWIRTTSQNVEIINNTNSRWKVQISQGKLWFYGKNIGDNNVINFTSSISIATGSWVNVLFSFSLSSTANRYVYINDVLDTGVTWTTYDTSGTIDRTGTGSWYVGLAVVGYMTNVYADYTYRNLSVTANRRYFINSNGTETAPSVMSALSPILYLPLQYGYSVGQNLGTGGDFVPNGTGPSIVNSGPANLIAGKGGMVWIKQRSSTQPNFLNDTARGATKFLSSNTTDAEGTEVQGLTSFSSSGFSVGSRDEVNGSAATYASWTFRKAEKFFDVVTYTGNGTTQSIAHNLGSVPGCIIVKRVSAASNTGWPVYHRYDYTQHGFLNLTGSFTAAQEETWFGNNLVSVAPTASVFTVGSNQDINASSNTYVAYLFAHNAGGFGADSSENVISCGSYTGNGSATGPTITLGWEPQFVLIKNASAVGYWFMFDSMRGIATGGTDALLWPNVADAEANSTDNIDLTATGFQIKNSAGSINGSGNTLIYIAIRRPMKPPSAGTEVFSPQTWSGNGSGTRTFSTSFNVDFTFPNFRNLGATHMLFDRLRGSGATSLDTASSQIEGYNSGQAYFDQQNGIRLNTTFNSSSIDYVNWLLRRAPGFMDVVCYTGTGVDLTVNHNLGVVPEWVIIKNRSRAGTNWSGAYFVNASQYYDVRLNQDIGRSLITMGPGGPTLISNSATTFGVLGGSTLVNTSGDTYVAYLFATLPGISKVGSYTGNGTNQTINCGFTSGARFVLIKRTDSTGDWYVWDTTRGIVSANDPHLSLNTTAVEVTTDDSVDPVSSGFIVNQVAATNVNVSSATYIYLAIA